MEILNKLYNEDLNYDNLNTLYHKAKKLDDNITLKQVKEFLKNQETYQLNYKNNNKKKYKPKNSDIYYSYQIDLTFLGKFKKRNSNYSIIFTAINIDSRYVYAYPLKQKSADEILEKMQKFLKDCDKIDILTYDKGKEMNY